MLERGLLLTIVAAPIMAMATGLWVYIGLAKAQPRIGRNVRLGWALVNGVQAFGVGVSLITSFTILATYGSLWGLIGFVVIAFAGTVGSVKLGERFASVILSRLGA